MRTIRNLLRELRRYTLYIIIACAMSVLATTSVVLLTRRLTQTAEARLELTINSATNIFKQQYSILTTMLRSIQGLYAANQSVTRKEFYDFIEATGFHHRNPGFSTFAFVQCFSDAEKEQIVASIRADDSTRPGGYPNYSITPPGKRTEYCPIVYIDPESTSLALLGSDQAAEPARAANLLRAKDTGEISLSQPVYLLPKNKPGLIVAAPIYRSSSSQGNATNQQRQFIGVVTSAFYLDDFIRDSISLTSLGQRGIGLTFATPKTTPIQITQKAPDSIFAQILFPQITHQENIAINGADIQLLFSSSVAQQLSFAELCEPIIVLVGFVGLTLILFLLASLQQRNADLRELKKRQDFITTLSHQLRTPLTKIQWAIELESLDTKGRRANPTYSNVQEGVTELNSIVNHLLFFIEWDQNQIQQGSSHTRAMPIRSAITEALNTLRFRPDLQRVQRDLNAECPCIVHANPERLTFVLSALIENALTYSDPKTNVRLSVLPQNGFVSIRVEDRGFGIPAKEQDRVFQDFFRASNASLGKNAGSGVSLSMSKRIAQTMNGALTFTSTENKGSTFALTLPTNHPTSST